MSEIFWGPIEPHWFFLLFMLLIEVGLLVIMLVKKEEKNKLYKQKLYQRKGSYRLKVYFLITVSAMLLMIFNFLIVTALFLSAFVYLTFKEKQVWSEMEAGKLLVEGSGIEPGVRVAVNRAKEGIVKKMDPTMFTLHTKEDTKVTIPYAEVKEIEIFGQERLVKESLVLNFREDPVKAMELLTNLTRELNTRFIKEVSEVKEKQFRVAGIESTNSGFHGMLYTIEGSVRTEEFDRISSEVRLELATMAHVNELKMAETNVFYRTRLNA